MLPDYWIERPPMSVDVATQSAIEAFLQAEADVTDGLLDVDELLRDLGAVTRWTFLCGLAAGREIAFHGTGDPGIEAFEPRQPIDFAPFGDQKAVFATSDPIWAMFYAIVDRARYPITLNNGCIAAAGFSRSSWPASLLLLHQRRSTREATVANRLRQTSCRPQGFVEQPSGPYGGHTARVPQPGVSPVAVAPHARVQVTPEDFPFLAHIRGHDDERLAEYAQAVMSAAPWPT